MGALSPCFLCNHQSAAVGGFCGVRSTERAKTRGSEDKLSENDSGSEILIRVKQNSRERSLRSAKP